jgi:hypothetical protein
VDYTIDSISGLEMPRKITFSDLVIHCCIHLYPCIIVLSLVTFEIPLYYLCCMLVLALICHHNVVLLPLSG